MNIFFVIAYLQSIKLIASKFRFHLKLYSTNSKNKILKKALNGLKLMNFKCEETLHTRCENCIVRS